MFGVDTSGINTGSATSSCNMSKLGATNHGFVGDGDATDGIDDGVDGNTGAFCCGTTAS